MPLVMHKNLGETPLQALDRLRIEKPDYAAATLSYAGRLDPMAEGVMIVLVGDECKEPEREKFLGLDKTYNVEIIWGLDTDTHDILGVVSEYVEAVDTSRLGEMTEALHSLVGTRRQQYPLYSSKPYEGKPLFAWAREGKLADLAAMSRMTDGTAWPSKDIEIYRVDVGHSRKIIADELLEQIEERIALVHGDFRQEEILAAWRELLQPIITDQNSEFAEFMITPVTIACSSGTYIRQLVQELGKSLGCGAIVWKLERTKVGEFV